MSDVLNWLIEGSIYNEEYKNKRIIVKPQTGHKDDVYCYTGYIIFNTKNECKEFKKKTLLDITYNKNLIIGIDTMNSQQEKWTARQVYYYLRDAIDEAEKTKPKSYYILNIYDAYDISNEPITINEHFKTANDALMYCTKLESKKWFVNNYYRSGYDRIRILKSENGVVYPTADLDIEIINGFFLDSNIEIAHLYF